MEVRLCAQADKWAYVTGETVRVLLTLSGAALHDDDTGSEDDKYNRAHGSASLTHASTGVHVDWLCAQWCGVWLRAESEEEQGWPPALMPRGPAAGTALPDETLPARGRTCFCASAPAVVAAGIQLKPSDTIR